jgi:hypothetical protein
MWLFELGVALCSEYTRRYGRVHASRRVLDYLTTIEAPNIPSLGFTSPPQAMPVVYHGTSSIEAYRLYYKQEKRHLFAWKRGDMPGCLKFPFLDDIRKHLHVENEMVYAVETVAAAKKRKR